VPVRERPTGSEKESPTITSDQSWRLENPPVIEAWIEFHFESAAETETWSEGAINQFFGRFPDLLVHRERFIARQVAIEDPLLLGKTGSSTVHVRTEDSLVRVRVSNESRTRWIQVARNLLVHNVARHGTEYPGFDSLRDKALDVLGTYCEHFRPQFVREAVLHYTDLIDIPAPKEGMIHLPDYFNLFPQTPDAFSGVMAQFAQQIIVRPRADGDDAVLVDFRTETSPAEKNVFRFRMDWHCGCSRLDTLDLEIIRRRLGAIRDCVRGMFRECFKQPVWNTFQPILKDASNAADVAKCNDDR
jgi:uncharacterized protein (TIGR04255 family)